MSTRHAGLHAHLYVPGVTVVHRLAPVAKLLGTVAFALAVALTPRTAWAAFIAHAVVLAAVVAVARIPARTTIVRLAAVVPFLAFAVLVPFVAGGPHVEVASISLSRDGLWAGFGIACKALLGAGASIVFAATTPVPAIIAALSRLRVPPVLVGIVAFMLRYLDVLADQLRRMRTAMAARGHDPRWLWQARPVAASAGTLFVRTYERGERVYLAMVARGFTGTLPDPAQHAPADPAPPLLAAVPAALATLAIAGWALA